MGKIKMTEDGLNAMRPSTTGSVKDLFADDDNQAEKTNKKLSNLDEYEAQKDVIHYVTIHEELTCYFSNNLLPAFKKEKAENYKAILKQFSKLEIENSRSQAQLWDDFMESHKQKANITFDEIRRNTMLSQQNLSRATE